MTDTNYDYSIQTDFPNHIVEPSRLSTEIRNSAIVTALSYISSSGDTCSIWFRATLSETDEGILDSLVAAHSGAALPPSALPVQLYAGEEPVPTASDGKPYVLPNIFPGEVLLQFAGCDDKLDAPVERWGGDLFGLQKTGTGSTSRSMEFLDGVYLAGGHLCWSGGSYGSFVYLELWAPASTVKAPATPNQGNCDLVPTGLGFNIIVPAAGDGEYDLDAPVPVPANDDETDAPNGYWNYSEPWLGKGVVSAGTPQHARYNLFDEDIKLAHFARIHVMHDEGNRDLYVASIKPKWILPEWQFKIEIHNADANKTLSVAWDLLTARRRST